MASEVLSLPETAYEPSAEKRVLLISYHFPPVGGAGVQRPLKFVKYLPEFGWKPTVLTAENPSAPVFDESLCRDISDEALLVRARTWEPSYQVKQSLQASAATSHNRSWKSSLAAMLKHVARGVLQPDPQILWLPNAYRAALRLLKQTPHAALLATAPTYTNLILGALLKRRFGIPLLLDFRDEWDLSSRYLENRSQGWFSTVVQRQQQRFVLRSADALLATTERSAAAVRERALEVGRDIPANCIYNGFDEEDFRDSQAENGPSGDKFHLVYTGTLWKLTNVEPVVAAIEQLDQRCPELTSRLVFHCVGRKLPEQQEHLQRLRRTRCELIDSDYRPHAEVVQLMQQADALCLLLSDVEGAERVAPGKFFEYLAARRPMLAVLPTGETASLVRRFQPENQFLPSQIDEIREWLQQQLDRHQRGVSAPRIAWSEGIREFSRRGQTGMLAELLDETVNRTTRHAALARV